jgi:hypothetical protein
MSFIEQIVDHTLKHHQLEDLKGQLYLFPSKRAVLQFYNILKKKTPNTAYLLPKAQTIQEFFLEMSNVIIADELFLLQKLYTIHERITQNQQTFHQFISWGKLILKDFDEIDKYLVDTNYFFNVLQAHKNIDEHYALDELAEEYLKLFYNNIENEKQGIFYEDFVKTWQYLGQMYQELQQELRHMNLAYEGMAYRKLVTDIIEQKIKIRKSKIIFCGFNAFTTCEEKLLDTLILQNNVETWWDIDPVFMENKLHEAGNFLRIYAQKYIGKEHHWCADTIEHKKINIVSIPSNIGQIHYTKHAIDYNNNNCIVLCDETMVDYCLPIFDKEMVNITMGKNIKNSNVFNIVQAYLLCLQNIKTIENATYIYSEDLVNLFSFQEFSNLNRASKQFNIISKYNFPINIKSLSSYIDDEFIINIFQTLESKEILENTILLIDYLPKTHTNENHIAQFLKEKISELHKIIDYQVITSIKDITSIFQNYISNQTIAFETNRKSPTQIMGFLETRLQDFDNLYILNLNDNRLPGTNKSNSFIPYNLRKSFALPTFDQFDGINAYHFYRLLKRANHIYLIYNSSSLDADNEKSRFIKQIEYEFDKNVSIISEQATNMLSVKNIKQTTDISIQKTQDILERLKTIQYSASSLNTYLTCPVQFYLKYILRIEEPDELKPSKEAADFGTLLHRILELYYTKNKQTTSNLDKAELDVIINQAIADLGYSTTYFLGKNALTKKILEKLTFDILAIDVQTNFNIMSLEHSLETTIKINEHQIKIKGKIDRIDKVQDKIRIIDYKTGNVVLCDFPIIDDEKGIDIFFQKTFNQTNTMFKEVFQGLLYAWLYRRNYPDAKIIIGYFTAKKLQDGINFLNNGKEIDNKILDLFEEKLVQLLHEILYVNKSFVISNNSKAYQYATAYKELLLI